MSKEELGNYTQYKYPNRKHRMHLGHNTRFVPEQYFAVSALQRNGLLNNCQDWTDWDEEKIVQSEWFIMNNFIVLDFSHHGIILPKYNDSNTANTAKMEYAEKGLYTFERYRKVYERMFLEHKSTDDLWEDQSTN